MTKAITGVEIVSLDPCNYKNITVDSETSNSNEYSGKSNNIFNLTNMAEDHTKIKITGISTIIEL